MAISNVAQIEPQDAQARGNSAARGVQTPRDVDALKFSGASRAWKTTAFMANEPAGVRAEAMRALRQKLRARGNPRRIIVTSLASKDARGVAAVNLGLALAESGREAVLVASLDGSSTAAMGTNGWKAPGLLAQLNERRGQQDRERHGPWVVGQLVNRENFYLLPAGEAKAADSNDGPSAHLVTAAATQDALQALAASFQRTVLLCPPVSEGPDVALLQDVGDAVVIVATAGRSEVEDVHGTLAQIDQEKFKGFILLEA